MPWIELIDERNRKSRIYQDSQNLSKKAWSGTISSLHYESVIDSGVFDAEIDFTPIRVDNPQFDGWRITANGWHYALGKDIANHGDQDGWVGFGGRKGARWFKFRLTRVGYLHWPTRVLDDIGGAPNYDRTNLSSETHSLILSPNDDSVICESVAKLESIWTTPGGGDLSVQWRARADGLKEEIIINQAGREWIATNRPPTTPLNETYFGFVFRLDWSDIPKIIRAGVELSPDGDFADDGEDIVLRDVLDQLIAFMPLSDVRVQGIEVGTDERQPIRKRFWSENGNHHLLVGVRCDLLNGMGAGDLTFDPTVSETVTDDADDLYNDREDRNYVYWNYTSPIDMLSGHRFQTVGITKDGTITTAYMSIVAYGASVINAELYGEDIGDSGVLEGGVAIDERIKTSAHVTWFDISMDTEEHNDSPSIISVISEITSRADWVSGNDLTLIGERIGTAYNFQSHDYQGAPGYAGKLYVEYDEPAPPAGQPTQVRTQGIPTGPGSRDRARRLFYVGGKPWLEYPPKRMPVFS